MATASTPKNRIVRSTAPNQVFVDVQSFVTASISWNQGDLLCLDTSANTIRTMTSGGEAADSANFLGIAINTVSSGILVGPYTGLATVSKQALGLGIAGPMFGVDAALLLFSGDALVPGSKVYAKPSDSPWTVSVAGTNVIGVYNGPAITGNGTLTVNIRLGCRYPTFDI